MLEERKSGDLSKQDSQTNNQETTSQKIEEQKASSIAPNESSK